MPTLVEALLIVTALAAIAAWIGAFASAMHLLSLRAAHVSLTDLAFRGAAFFDPANFRPEAAPWLRRFRTSFLAFFVAVFTGAALSFVMARSQGR